MICATYNRMEQARELYAELVSRYPEGQPKTVEQFIPETWSRRAEDLDTGQALAAVESALYQSAFWQLLGDADAAAGHEQIAKLCWDAYMSKRMDPELRARTGLPPIETIRDRAIERVHSDLERVKQEDSSVRP